jgi:hypothetical protein
MIFSAPMVRALLAGTKTQTRRKITERIPCDQISSEQIEDLELRRWDLYARHMLKLPAFVGDRLWVREAFQQWPPENIRAEPDRAQIYRATDPEPTEVPDWAFGDGKFRWRSPIHMPRWASRLTLTVTEVRVQRLQEISRDDAIAEGLTLASNAIEEFWRWPPPHEAGLWLSPIAAYRSLWDSLHGAGSWEENPWVAVISFEVERNA